ncbi:MAG: hypothetical protein WCS65_04055 [Verrucomicrobiae bacterium]
MEFRTVQTSGCTLDEMSSGGLRVLISRKGAEMVSLSRNETGFLYRDGEAGRPASGWANHATVMGYFVHRLWNEQSAYRGKTLCGGTHGFLRHFDFDEPERLADGLAYHVPAGRVPEGAYPLRVGLVLSYRILKGSLRIDFSFWNEEPDIEAHVSFGLHPGFAVSPEAKVILPAGTYVRHFAPGNFLDGTSEVFEFPGGEFPYPKRDLPGSFLLGIEGVPVRQFLLEDAGRSVALDFSEAPYATFWSDSDQFLCIEPCWGLPDSNPPAPFEKKAGIQTIPPGGQIRRGFSITPHL